MKMMNRIAKFEKVSFNQYLKDRKKLDPDVNEQTAWDEWEAIKLPTRATTGSAGYDFYMPFTQKLMNWKVIPTGIRCKIEDGWMLALFPKSGIAFNYGFKLANTVGIVDADYYNSDNEGHIMIKCRGEVSISGPCFEIDSGKKFAQGIFIPFGIADGDEADGIRNGGFGSTGA